MYDLLVNGLQTFNEFLTAGIAITAFSLLLYALSFNLRDRVARSFALITVCVVIVYVGDAMVSVANTPFQDRFWLLVQWPGIIFLPPAYLHFSDAVLATTGRPSRGRRRAAVRLIYLLSLGFLAALLLGWMVGPLVMTPSPHLQRTWIVDVFTIFYASIMVIAWINLLRTYQRSATSASRRRMTYLILGSLAPALGSFPYLAFGSAFAADHPLIFWLAADLSNILVSVFLVLMAYAVAFFGVPWPDRVVKRRLFKWLMRGPITASTTLMITTLVRRSGVIFGIDFTALAPVAMVASVLVFEHLITLLSPIWERWLFYGRDRADVELLQTMEERLLTSGDLRQFLESVLVAVCDRLQTNQAFIAALSQQGVDLLVTVGGDSSLDRDELSVDLLEMASQNGLNGLFTWGDYWLVPLDDPEQNNHNGLLGLLGVTRQPERELDAEQAEALAILSSRAALALRDRKRQQQVFSSLEELTPQVEMIQRLRAASRYEGSEILAQPGETADEQNLAQSVKDALTHYWGGPKLTQSPLLELEVVQQTMREGEETPANALRTILRRAIDQTRPDGDRRFTTDWLMYNLLEMKFLEGRKVREIAMRLAMSEADLYRKQRVAIEAVAGAIV
ncbi:MAG: hypothetical protein MUE67_10495, partial [Anaerolineales bacterium]|nr:hypothetical protein [Anaerolineales bacterium]